MQLMGKELFRANMEKKLAKRPEIAAKRASRPWACLGSHSLKSPLRVVVIPEFPVACRRLTPGPGYLEALCEDNVCRNPAVFVCVETHLRAGRFRLGAYQAVH